MALIGPLGFAFTEVSLGVLAFIASADVRRFQPFASTLIWAMLLLVIAAAVQLIVPRRCRSGDRCYQAVTWFGCCWPSSLRSRGDGEWEVKLDPRVNKVLP